MSSEGTGNFVERLGILWNKNLLLAAMLSYKKKRKMMRNIGSRKTL